METEETKDDKTVVRNDALAAAIQALSDNNLSITDYLTDVVASTCGVDKNSMMNDSKQHNVQARWLFWFAYRYMMNESYRGISERSFSDRKYSPAGVGKGIAKMAMMIDTQQPWKRRWSVIKNVVKAINSSSTAVLNVPEEKPEVRIVIRKPENVNIKVEYLNE